MVKFIDSRGREEEILSLIIDCYIKESKPISSAYLCHNCQLNYSSATIRNIMLSLEKQGFLSHIFTSSGRVPTQQGFRYYVESAQRNGWDIDNSLDIDYHSLPSLGVDEIVNYTLDSLSQFSGYTSLVAISGSDKRFSFKGVRLILEQPEFEDVKRLKDLLYAFEVKMDDLASLLFDCIDENIQILIGDDIGFDEISGCSLVASGLHGQSLDFAMAILGPMRMNYTRAASCLSSVKNQLKEVVGDCR